jgi:hypothetical protein
MRSARSRPRSDPGAVWIAAARGACINGDHAAERRYRNAARLIRRRPPLTARARCIERLTR